MRAFASHASHCSRCADPYRTHLEGGTLCDRGHALAHDITQYIYSKAGLPFSVTDRERTGDRVQIEVPPGYDAVRSLLKAMDRGLRIRGTNEAKEPAVSQRHYYVPERTAPRMERRPEATIVEVRPSTSSRKDDRRKEGGEVRRGTGEFVSTGRAGETAASAIGAGPGHFHRHAQGRS